MHMLNENNRIIIASNTCEDHNNALASLQKDQREGADRVSPCREGVTWRLHES